MQASQGSLGVVTPEEVLANLGHHIPAHKESVPDC